MTVQSRRVNDLTYYSLLQSQIVPTHYPLSLNLSANVRPLFHHHPHHHLRRQLLQWRQQQEIRRLLLSDLNSVDLSLKNLYFPHRSCRGVVWFYSLVHVVIVLHLCLNRCCGCRLIPACGTFGVFQAMLWLEEGE